MTEEKRERCSKFLKCRILETIDLLNQVLNLGVAHLTEEDYDEEYIQKTISLIYRKAKVFRRYIFNEPRCEIYCLENDTAKS
jgi:hypothetical protein